MEVLPLVRRLWRRRLLLAAGAVVALALALALALGTSSPKSSAMAWTAVALDTPTSALVVSAPNGADTLPWRASLLAHLMTTDAAQRQLAARLGVRPDLVTVIDASLAVPLIAASLPQEASKAAATSAPYVLTLKQPDTSLPVVSIQAAAPDRTGATRLAKGAVSVLESQASPGGSYTSPIPTGGILKAGAAKLQPFVVEDVADVRAKRVAKSYGPIKAAGPPAFLLLLWCACLMFFPRRQSRRPGIAGAA
jgi:hypothetical protein